MLDNAFALGLPALLISAAVFDLYIRRIPNTVSGLTASLWMLYALSGSDESSVQNGLLAGSAVFAACFVLWRSEVLGGGDVKLLSAVALWAGVALLTPFLLITALFGGILCVLWLFVRRTRPFMPIRLASVLSDIGLPTLPGDDRGLPYGVAISLAGLWLSHRLLWS